MSVTVIWCDWGDCDTQNLQLLWQGVKNIQLVHVTEWNDVVERNVETAIANEKDTLLFCGHGTSFGLLVPNSCGEYVIHENNVNLINAERVIGVQCWGSEFAKIAGLHGFFTSMFISNIDESVNIGIVNTTASEIESSNCNFFVVISRLVGGELTMEECLAELQKLGYNDPVSSFNVSGIEIL